MTKSLTWSKVSRLLKNSYVELAILGLILLGSVFVFWFGLRAALRNDYPLLVVASTSMLPTLDVSDIIVVQGTNAIDIRAGPQFEGDIIVFFQPYNLNTRIVHRAINMSFHEGLWYFQTKGDNNPTPDSWSGPNTWDGKISEKLLVGKVVGVIEWVGNVPLFIRTPQGTVVIVLLFIIILLIEYIPVPWGKQKEEEKDKTSSSNANQGL